ncbi:MAG: DegQ family serine endoprotease [Rhizobiales bacterium]|nr:DegQ family serine endoprotease [Hyphomicrobiales bacterium]
MIAVLLLTFGAGIAGVGAAENGNVLGDIMNELLRGSDDGAATPPSGAQDGATAPEPARRVPFGREDMQLSFAPLVRKTTPAVVNVYATKKPKAVSPFAGDPFFEEFFGGGQMTPRVQQSLGSGVIVDASGLVVTNYHVIANADELKVALADGREFQSKVLLKDEALDLAVLKIDAAQPFPTVPIGDSDAIEIGDLVLAIGNPFGVGQTTTSGIVSALARSHIGVSDFGFFIQTDAAINPGNSGGALVDMGGRLVGINTAIYSRSGGSIGIGFAIPSNMVRAVVASAKAGKDYFERPYLGATFDAVTAQIAEALGMTQPSGAIVSSVEEGGPAKAAGLKPGDIVLTMNGVPIEHVDALGYRLATQAVGATIKLGVLSGGEQREVAVTLGLAPAGQSSAEITIDGDSPFAGATVAELSPRLAERLNIRSQGKGVAMTDVERNSPAGQFGFQPRDVIREVNGEVVDTPEKLKEAASQNTRWWRFTMERDGRVMKQMLRY